MPRRVLPRASPTRRRLLRLYEALARRYGPQDWWPARSRFETIVGAVLAQNTRWRNVELALTRLRAAGVLAPEPMSRLSPGRLASLLKPSGTFRVKARRLRAVVGHLRRHHGGDVDRMLRAPAPALRTALLDVPGVGPETADTILLYAAGRPIFVVDAYTHRILARHRLVPPTLAYGALQDLFVANLPHDPGLFGEYHALLVRVAKDHCR